MQTWEIRIRGIVQGVGFRPFIHRLVRAHALKGSIRNTSSGVTLTLEGDEDRLSSFLRELPEKAPPLAVIEEIRTDRIPFQGFSDFRIIESERQAERNTLISPDIGICPDCLREMRDPADRRYRFPFINCTSETGATTPSRTAARSADPRCSFMMPPGSRLRGMRRSLPGLR